MLKLRDDTRLVELHTLGMHTTELADVLGVSQTTVKNHLRALGLRANGRLNITSSGDAAMCRKCRLVRPLSLFYPKSATCKPCVHAANGERLNRSLNSYIGARFATIKVHARRRGIEFSITKDEWFRQYNDQSGLCFYTDERLRCRVGEGHSQSAMSADRMNNDVGYRNGNVVFCTYRANACKHDASLAEVSRWMPGWYARIAVKLGLRDGDAEPWIPSLTCAANEASRRSA